MSLHTLRIQDGREASSEASLSYIYVALLSCSQAPVNFFGGSPLNRLSWLRTSEHFLNAIVTSAATRWVLFKAGQPLLVSEPETKKRKMSPTETDKSDLAPTSNLLIKRLSEKARLPTRGSALAAGYDLYRCVFSSDYNT